MRSVNVTKVLTAADDDNIALSQTPAAASYLTIAGAAASGGVATLDTQRQVLITTASDEHTKNYVILGTDEAGAPLRYSGALPNATTAAIPLNFYTVTSFYVDAALTGAIKVGTNTVGSTPWKLFGDTIATPNLEIYMELLNGAGNASFEYTDDVFLQPIGVQSAAALGPNSPNPTVLQHPVLTGLTGSMEGQVTWAVTGWRLTVNSGTGSWKCSTRQAGLASP